MKAYGGKYFHLLSATVRPDVKDVAAFLTAVVQPLCLDVSRTLCHLTSCVTLVPTLTFLQADVRGVPCYVEVTQPALVPYYEGLGFEAPESPKDVFGVPVRPMRRLPAKAI